MSQFNELREEIAEEIQSFKDISTLTAINADQVMTELLIGVESCGYDWINPFIYSDEGNLCIEWYNANHTRALHFDFEDDFMQYTKLWGDKSNIQSEKKDVGTHNCVLLWAWFITKQQ